jgi:hypothetical protein
MGSGGVYVADIFSAGAEIVEVDAVDVDVRNVNLDTGGQRVSH